MQVLLYCLHILFPTISAAVLRAVPSHHLSLTPNSRILVRNKVPCAHGLTFPFAQERISRSRSGFKSAWEIWHSPALQIEASWIVRLSTPHSACTAKNHMWVASPKNKHLLLSCLKFCVKTNDGLHSWKTHISRLFHALGKNNLKWKEQH